MLTKEQAYKSAYIHGWQTVFLFALYSWNVSERPYVAFEAFSKVIWSCSQKIKIQVFQIRSTFQIDLP